MRRKDVLSELAEIDCRIKRLTGDALRAKSLSANLTTTLVAFAKESDAVLRVTATGGTYDDFENSEPSAV